MLIIPAVIKSLLWTVSVLLVELGCAGLVKYIIDDQAVKQSYPKAYNVLNTISLVTFVIAGLGLGLNTAILINSVASPIVDNPSVYYQAMKYGINNGAHPIIIANNMVGSRTYPNKSICFIEYNSKDPSGYPQDFILYHEMSHCVDKKLKNNGPYKTHEAYADVAGLTVYSSYHLKKETSNLALDLMSRREQEAIYSFKHGPSYYQSKMANYSISKKDSLSDSSKLMTSYVEASQLVMAYQMGMIEIKDYSQFNDHYSTPAVNLLMLNLEAASKALEASEIDTFVSEKIVKKYK